MAVFSLVVSTVKTAYDAFLTARAQVATDQAAIVGLGARPKYPAIVVVNNDWNNVTTSQNTYDATLFTYTATLDADEVLLRTAELAVIAALGYGSGDVPPSHGNSNGICLDQWVEVVGSGGGILTYTNWIGCASNATYLVILLSEPLNAFPDKTLAP